MLTLFFLSALLMSPFAQETHDAYAHQDAEALRSLLAEADSRVDSLLVRYRLYPVTEDKSIVDSLPDALPDGSARELALLSGLWAYRAGEASVFRTIQYGRRSTNLLEAAKAKDDSAPFVLLVEGQSLLFRPSFAGADAGAAVHCFHRLLRRTTEESGTGISQTEALLWLWFSLRKAGRPDDASIVRTQLSSRNPPSLYQQFLEDPPDL